MTDFSLKGMLCDPRKLDPKRPSGLWWCQNLNDVALIGENAAMRDEGCSWDDVGKDAALIEQFPFILVCTPPGEAQDEIVRELTARFRPPVLVPAEGAFRRAKTLEELFDLGGKNGEIRIFGITGTLVIQETETIPGYVLNKHSQTVKVNADDVQTITFYNTPLGGVELIKVDAADKSKRLIGAVFEIRKMNDALVDTVTTGKNGRVYADLDAGSYYALEIEAPKGYKLDKTPYYFKVKNGETTSVTITNKALSGVLIHKTDNSTGKALQGVTFLLYDSKNTPRQPQTMRDTPILRT